MLSKLEYRLALAGRHQLNYAKLYHDFEDGYDMETLKNVLKDVKEDREKTGLSLENLYAEKKNPLI